MAIPIRPIIVVRKKRAAHSASHGGAWKVAYADFVTAMMALFIVLWLANSKQEVRKAVGGYFQDPTGRGKNQGTAMQGTGRDLTPLKDDMSGLAERLKAMVKLTPHFNQMKNHIEFTITSEGLRIELMEGEKGMFFEIGKPVPTPFGQELLLALAKEIGRLPNHLLIEGHSDAAPYTGDDYSNWELSSDRANQARRLMEKNGLSEGQVSQVRGYADRRLRSRVAPTDPSNRRVSLIILYRGAPDEIKVSPGDPKQPAGAQIQKIPH